MSTWNGACKSPWRAVLPMRQYDRAWRRERASVQYRQVVLLEQIWHSGSTLVQAVFAAAVRMAAIAVLVSLTMVRPAAIIEAIVV